MPVQAKTLFEVVFAEILKEKKKQIADVDGVIMFTVTGDGGGIWTMDLRKGGDGEVHFGRVDNPDVTIVLAEDFLDDFMAGTYDPVEAIKTAKLGIVGRQGVFDAFSKLLLSRPAGAAAAASKSTKLQEPKKGGVSLR